MVADISQLFRVRHLGSKLRRIGLLMALLAGLCYLSQGPTVVHPSVVPQVDVQGEVIKKFCLCCFVTNHLLIKFVLEHFFKFASISQLLRCWLCKQSLVF